MGPNAGLVYNLFTLYVDYLVSIARVIYEAPDLTSVDEQVLDEIGEPPS